MIPANELSAISHRLADIEDDLNDLSTMDHRSYALICAAIEKIVEARDLIEKAQKAI